MNSDILNEACKLRNEIRRKDHRLDLTELANRLKASGVSLPPSELSTAIPALLKIIGADSGQYFVPQVVLKAMAGLLEGQSA